MADSCLGFKFILLANEDPTDKLYRSSTTTTKHAQKRLFAAFMIFGLLNNVLYVIILSAALDLVPSTTPKGIVALFNILPALLTKVVWPLVSNGKIRYTRRVGFCTCVSWLGIMTIAFSKSLTPRLLGISMASLSSGLGELTFLQLTTTLPTKSTSKTALGAWSSGTGFAGIAGAGIWWLLRGLGVKGGLGLSSVLPLFFPLTYKFLLPSFSSLGPDPSDSSRGLYQPLATDAARPSILITPPSQDPVPRSNDDVDDEDDTAAIRARAKRTGSSGSSHLRLSTAEKLTLLRPLVLRYMVPLAAVYVEEYVINSGVAPTLVFPLPTSGIWSMLFKSPRDYYPFWSLTYQTFVFLSRSSLSLSIPPIPLRFLPLPSIIQFFVLSALYIQAKHFIFSSPAYTPPSPPPSSGVDRTIGMVFLLICIEGLCGGLGYVNTFYHVAREGEDENDGPGEEGKGAMEREFRIGAVGAADSTGILFASLISMPLEIALCNAQIEQGRTMCRDL
ncbi:protein BTN1 [Kwoniella heveanensis BCC8398]|uniref:Protein BTN n=1 Tax=Kwoniella heveanensis BCC8398 TaxID=1296120 RepID=A0A1B9GXE2_9TREE|nr:protein BTN1 [Kwoniella heveanensis BCC8398]